MTTHDNVHSGNNCFSLNRVAMLYQYNGPWIKRQLLIYLAVSLLTAATLLLSGGSQTIIKLYNFMQTILLYMYLFSPLVFAKGGDSRALESILPASNAEKLFFYLSYLLVIMPFICYAIPMISEIVYLSNKHLTNEELVLFKWYNGQPVTYVTACSLSTVAAMLTGLYFLLKSRTMRILKAVLLAIGAQLALNLIITIPIMVKAFTLGYKAAIENKTDDISTVQIAQEIIESLNSYTTFSICMVVLTVLYIIVMSCLTYRAISHR